MEIKKVTMMPAKKSVETKSLSSIVKKSAPTKKNSSHHTQLKLITIQTL